MSEVVIRAENLGKSYIIGHEKHEGYTALRDVLASKVKQIAVKTRQIFHGGQLIAGQELEEFWALKDISFEIKQGDNLGIIGRNGAGKSTLLKVLSRITEPTTGRIRIKGRVASLLEVGTGFHPELSGRENIYLNGAILGMSRKEIKKKFDEIVDFSGVEKFLDTPVKRYSSGMYVRLAFAVAAHMESEILVVDEVLAVGDAEFQKKCLGKMGDVSTREGRTVLFVSHNMAAVKNLCNNGIVLKNGRLEYIGRIDKCINSYLMQNIVSNSKSIQDVSETKRSKGSQNAIKKVWIENKDNQSANIFLMGEKMKFCFEFNLFHVNSNINVGFGIEDTYGNRIFSLNNEMLEGKLFENIKSGVAVFCLPENILLPGSYYLTVSIVSGGIEWIDFLPQAINFFVEPADIYGTGKLPVNSQGVISVKGEIFISVH